MSSECQLKQHWQKQNITHNAFILFEGGSLSHEIRHLMLTNYKDRCTPLYQIPELKKIITYGPWLAHIKEENELNSMLSEKIPVAGIIFSALSLTHLASRLAIGCIAKTPDDRKVLLRFYTPHVLKHLAARPDMEWHPVLFSQTESWWVQENSQWHQLNIPASVTNNPAPDNLNLDNSLWQKVKGRDDVSALVREWSMMKIGNQFPPCARRNMVEKALDKARQIGLIKPLDQKIYALSYLNGEKEYLESAEFQAVLEKVKKNEISLSDIRED
ncbi:DUF4123 domain-containing protein [Citrobacter freundii]|uniref:DUF4123 domain-containing protein n=1 Tax=Citrobacter freundii TaxID=546 RepID=UPI00292AC932|nr:DUF4123 domain-containing protein [Citrobacter freundii]MDV0656560.1 DUF4123 domain-containing protein [Citrobacter freundii]MDV0722135.1 DUF4123 domain-containing protein [Citrobacter freundii]MEB0616916.1 DUF4123 domain-containing protein [Citrobacter freundii]MEB0692260.1 DUF4123 domain-containing protein [Citrobacter freundii]HEM7946013.1 DUF4123 domain-containing protein [Citrobacter freundii]